MKHFEPNQRYTTIAVYTFCVILFTILCVMVLLNLTALRDALLTLLSILKPVIYGLLIAYLLTPPANLAERRLFAFVSRKKDRPRLRRVLAEITVYLIVLAVLAGFFALLVPQVTGGYWDLESKITGYVTDAGEWISDRLDRFSGFEFHLSRPEGNVEDLILPGEKIPRFFALTVEEAEQSPALRELREIKRATVHFSLSKTFRDAFTDLYALLSDLTPFVLDFLRNIITEAKNIFMGLIISIYLLYARQSLRRGWQKLLQAIFGGVRAVRVSDYFYRINRIFFRYCSGMIADAAILTLIYLCFFACEGMPYAPLLAIILGFANIVPFVGPLVGLLPTAFIVFVISPPRVIVLLLTVVAVQIFDSRIIDRRVLHNPTMLEPVWIIVAVVLMGGLFGLPGMLLGVPVFTVLFLLGSETISRRLASRGEPTDTLSYYRDAAPPHKKQT